MDKKIDYYSRLSEFVADEIFTLSEMLSQQTHMTEHEIRIELVKLIDSLDNR